MLLPVIVHIATNADTTMTITPIIRFIIHNPLSSNLLRTLSIIQVRQNHHNSAPTMMKMYPADCGIGLSGTMNVNWLNIAMNKNIIAGFDTVTANPVMKLCIKFPLL